MADKHTFGCGELLPGYGPGSIFEPPPPTVVEPPPPPVPPGPPPVCNNCREGWDCFQPYPQVNGICKKSSNGQYGSASLCMAECLGNEPGQGGHGVPPDPPKWTCILPPIGVYGKGDCVPDANGTYTTFDDCMAKCKKPFPGTTPGGGSVPPGGGGPGAGTPVITPGGGPRYSCISDGICPGLTITKKKCVLDPAGIYTDPGCGGSCPDCPPPPGTGDPVITPGGGIPKVWVCNKFTWNCNQITLTECDHFGFTCYATSEECEANCKEPIKPPPGQGGGVVTTGGTRPEPPTITPGGGTGGQGGFVPPPSSEPGYDCVFAGVCPDNLTQTFHKCIAVVGGKYKTPNCENKCKKCPVITPDPPDTKGESSFLGKGLIGGIAKATTNTVSMVKDVVGRSLGDAIVSFGVMKNRVSSVKQIIGSVEITNGNSKLLNLATLESQINKDLLETIDPNLFMFGRPLQTTEEDFVSNNKYLDIFSTKVHRSVDHILSIANTNRDWDNFKSYELTDSNLQVSLNPTFINTLSLLKYADGRYLPLSVSLNMIRNLMYSNEIASFDLGKLLESIGSIKQAIVVSKSNDPYINELAALSIIEQNMVTLNPDKNPGRGGEILKNVQPIPYDLALAVPIEVEGKLQYFPIGETGLLMTGETYHVDDGDLITIEYPTEKEKLKLRSERDHAYTVGSEFRELALDTMGETDLKLLSASSTFSANIEFEYSLNNSGEAERAPFYILTSVVSSLETVFKGNHIVETKARFNLINGQDATVVERLNSFYLKHKYNYMIAFIHYDDLILDHIINSSSLTYKEKDIVFIQGGDKTNKEVPLLVRGFPKYIILLPTDKNEYQNFKSRSILTRFDLNSVERQLPLITTINERYRKKNPVDIKTALVDVFGNEDTDARIMELDVSGPQFSSGYTNPRDVHKRTKTGIRVFWEIVRELRTNYVLHNNALIPFDIFSRMTYKEYNKFIFIEGGMEIYNKARDGLFGPRIVEPVRGTIQHNIKSSLKNRLLGAPADVYSPIKSTNVTNDYILPPVDKNSVVTVSQTNPKINAVR